MPRVPKMCRILSTFATASSNTIGTRLTLVTQSSTGFIHAAISPYHALKANPAASGSRVSRNSHPAIFAEFTVTPGSKSGKTSGR